MPCCRPAPSSRSCCPARVADYSPALLDELMATGEVLWCGHGSLPGDDGWVSLHLADSAHVTLPGPDPDRVPSAEGLAVLDALAGGGAHFFRTLSDAGRAPPTTRPWPPRCGTSSGRAGSPATPSPRCARCCPAGAPRTGAPRPARAAPGTPGAAARSAARRRSARPSLPARTGPPQVTGRWSLLPPVDLDPTLRAYATAELLLDRHGILTRGAIAAEDVPGGFAAIYRVLGRAEEAGRVRRGYFVEGLGASQFGTTGAVDRLRSGTGLGRRAARPGPGGAGRRGARRQRPGQPVRRAPCLARPRGRPRGRRWHDAPADRPPTSAAGTSRAARPAPSSCSSTATSCSTSSAAARRCSPTPTTPTCCGPRPTALADAVRDGSLGRITVEKADGGQVLGSGHPVVAALEEAGFHLTPRGLRMRQVSGACPRVTPCTAPPTGSTPRCATPWSSGPSCAGPRCPTSTSPGRAPSRSSPAASTCCTGSTPAPPCTPTCGWRASGGSSTRAARTERALRRHDLRAAVLTARWSAFGLRLGMLDLVPTARESDLVGHLGPDVLGPDWDAAVAAARVTASERFVGDALLDQRVLRRGRHLLGQRDPVHRARAALDPGPRPRSRAAPACSSGCTG